MARPKPKPKPPKIEDEAQSRRFLDLARELEGAGELSPTEDGAAFERAFQAIVPPRRPKE